MNQRTSSYVLIASITLNAFLLGVISMHYFSKRGFMHERGKRSTFDQPAGEAMADQRGPRLLRGLVRAAGGPKDARVQALWSGHRQQLLPLREEINQSRERVLDALTREPFDRAALSEALNQALDAQQRAEQMANQGALDLAEKMTKTERETLRHLPERTVHPSGHLDSP